MVLAAVNVVRLRTRKVVRPMPERDLLRPAFETFGMPLLLLLWACRIWHRAALRRELLSEPNEALADFGVTRNALLVYLHRPFWQP